MNAVDGVRGDVDGTVETESHVGSPDVIVDGLRQMDHVQTFLAEEVCRLLAAIAAQDKQAVQAELVIVLLHGLDLVQAVFVRIADLLERRPGGAQHRSALRQDPGEIFAGQEAIIAVDHAMVSVYESVDFQFFQIVRKRLDDAAHRSVQCLAVASAGKQSDSLHVFPAFLALQSNVFSDTSYCSVYCFKYKSFEINRQALFEQVRGGLSAASCIPVQLNSTTSSFGGSALFRCLA